MQYSMSFNEESYQCRFDSKEEAIAEATARCEENGDSRFWIGEIVSPRQPETFFDIDELMDLASQQDDYGGEWAEDWWTRTKAQKEEIDAAVKETIGALLDKHKLRPAFWNIGKTWRFDVVNGSPVPA